MKPLVLIIDDDVSLRRVIEFSLCQAGYRVLSAADGEEGVSLFQRKTPDVVITDLQMSGMSGLEVVERVKSGSQRTQVIVITAFGTVENAVEAMKMGAYDFITKPFSRDHLRLVVEKALAFQGLEEENTRLRERLAEQSLSSFIAVAEKTRAVVALVRRVAASEATVLILGESGTGKEMIARAIHEQSERHSRAFVPVNCAAIPGELLESELFGHSRGSFTGAMRDRKGKFELADGGTIFLDEVGELPLELQPKLLRVLQEMEIEPVGGHPCKVDVRVVAATNRDLEELMAQGKFREDLFYRLAVIPVVIPPLRLRREDIPPLIAHFLKKHGNGQSVEISQKAMDRLIAYDWPGNIRELENLIERSLILSLSSTIEEHELPARVRLNTQRPFQGVLNLPETGYSLEAMEKEAIHLALLRNDWNRTRAASFLQIPRHVLVYRMEKFGIGKSPAVRENA
ncbi:MAG: sigma-54-dependent Fis family transcriptional regulator [Desulfuromonadales bacterium]|nr:sigma-54-dependent Fis family transcriptional regulator [Desulfuromonadales bacterium]